jgi:hypothetical protein
MAIGPDVSRPRRWSARTQLKREVEPRRLFGEPRPSVRDEQLLTDRVRDKEAAELAARAAELKGRIEHVHQGVDSLRKALGQVDRATYRDLDRIRLALERIQARYTTADRISVDTATKAPRKNERGQPGR